jgi:hypothetical protein
MKWITNLIEQKKIMPILKIKKKKNMQTKQKSQHTFFISNNEPSDII